MKKIEYRCNRCLIIEERFILNTQQPTHSTFCPKCGDLAVRLPLPIEKWKHKIFEDFAE